MRILTASALLALTAAPVVAQNHSVVFTGRFPFVSFDTINERAGGSITQLSEFDFSVVTPGVGAFARSWYPASAHQAFMGDVSGSNNYTPLRGLKTYFQRINMAAPFMKAADKSSFDPRNVFWTVRDQEAGIDIRIPTSGGVVPVLPGDFVRLRENGNAEYFITQALLIKAAGAPPTGQSSAPGASSMCQDAQGNLYYSPAEGGHWVYGNLLPAGPVFVYDGGICKIPASAITYDPNTGNVLDVIAQSSYVIFDEITPGPTGGPTIRAMVNTNSNAQDFNGGAFPPSTNMVGLDLDPNGGTLQASWSIGDPATGGTFDTVPNFVFCWDSGVGAGTIFSTAPNGVGLRGSIAVINGVKCGSDTTGVPADGSWLGVQLDINNFQPTLMGLLVIPALPYTPLVHDVPDFGALTTTAATLDLDYNGSPNAGTFLLLTFGPQNPGLVAPAVDFSSVVGPTSFGTLFTIPTPILPTPISAFLGVTDANGYISFIVNNPNTPGNQGLVLMSQGLSIQGSTIQLSTPVTIQYK